MENEGKVNVRKLKGDEWICCRSGCLHGGSGIAITVTPLTEHLPSHLLCVSGCGMNV